MLQPRTLPVDGKLQFEVEPFSEEHPSVEVWSTLRPVFEPVADALELREEIRASVLSLRAGPGETLDAVYQSADPGFCDLENVLFYNIGVTYFSQCAARTVRLRRLRTAPHASPGEHLYPHYLRYETAERALEVFPGRTLASFETAAMTGTGLFDSPWPTWAAAKRGFIDVIEEPRIGARLALHLVVDSPRVMLHPVRFLKPLVDGIVASFHSHNGAMLEEVAPRVAARLRIPAVDASRMLMDTAGNPLGERRLLWPIGESGVQVNPADDQLDEVLVQVRGSSDGATSVTGTLMLVG